MESVSGSDVRLPRVGDVELGHRARQEFERGMHRHVALSRGPVTGHCHVVPSRDTATGYRHRAPSQGTTRVRAREEPMVRWRRVMAHHCQAPHGHGIATSGVHMGIIVKHSEALPCVKSPVSRTSGTIYVVT